MLSLVRHIAGTPIARRSRARAQRFLDQTARADDVQHARLRSLIDRHAESQFGRDHHFHSIRDHADYVRQVPIRGYDGLEPYIDRVRKGDTGALFGAGTQVLMFAMTSGTTARPKTIPVTREALENYREGWTIWGVRTFDEHPPMMTRGLRPILQFNSNWQESRTPSGIPCGAITGLTAKMQNPLVRTSYCMPPATMGIKEIEAKYYTALRLSVHRPVGTLIAANPSTLLGLARLGDREKETLIRDLHDGRLEDRFDVPAPVRKALRSRIARKQRTCAKRLESLVNQTGHLYPRDYWPDLCFIACWTGGVMGAHLRSLPPYFGEQPIRDVGLIASEGRMTIPIADGTPAGVLDYTHHYYEFIPVEQADQDQPDTVEASELIEGREYYILLTTAGGLYRYNIHDVVRCAGFEGKAPLIEFLHKGAHISSLTGEKLSEHQVVQAVREALAQTGHIVGSFLLLPTWGDPPYYTLLVEEGDLAPGSPCQGLADAVEAALQRINLEYENKRSTRRLGPIRITRIVAGSWLEFQKRRLARSGGSAEQYKQPCLIPDLDSIQQFLRCDSSTHVESLG